MRCWMVFGVVIDPDVALEKIVWTVVRDPDGFMYP